MQGYWLKFASLMARIAYTIPGLWLIISQSRLLFSIVKRCGVAYLLYIGIKSLRAGKTELNIDVQRRLLQQSAARALVSVSRPMRLTTPRMRAVFARAGQWIVDRASGQVFITLGLKLSSQRI